MVQQFSRVRSGRPLQCPLGKQRGWDPEIGCRPVPWGIEQAPAMPPIPPPTRPLAASVPSRHRCIAAISNRLSPTRPSVRSISRTIVSPRMQPNDIQHGNARMPSRPAADMRLTASMTLTRVTLPTAYCTYHACITIPENAVQTHSTRHGNPIATLQRPPAEPTAHSPHLQFTFFIPQHPTHTHSRT